MLSCTWRNQKARSRLVIYTLSYLYITTHDDASAFVLHEEAETDSVSTVQLTTPGSEGTFETMHLGIPPTHFVFSAVYKYAGLIRQREIVSALQVGLGM